MVIIIITEIVKENETQKNKSIKIKQKGGCSRSLGLLNPDPSSPPSPSTPLYLLTRPLTPKTLKP